MTTIYLAGPMAGCTDQEVHQWRDLTKIDLPGFEFRDPSRRDFRGLEVTPKAVVDPDLEDIDDSDIVLANYWKVSTGTAMEICYAEWVEEKWVIVVVPYHVEVSPWLAYHALVVRSLDEAVDLIRKEYG